MHVDVQIIFLVNALGKTASFLENESMLEWRNFGQPGTALIRYILLSRSLLTVIAFALSLWAYADSWSWLIFK